MAEPGSERAQLIAYIRRRWRRMNASEAEELAHEALARALNTDGSLKGANLFEEAKDALRAIGRDAFWQQRRVPSAPGTTTDSLASGVPAPQPRRRFGSQRPKGTIAFNARETGFHMIELETGSPADDASRLAGYLLRTRILQPLEAHDALPASVTKKTLAFFAHMFGHAPSEAWASVLIQQVADAKLAQIALTEEKRAPPLPDSDGAVLTGHKPKDTRNIKLAIRTEVLSRRLARTNVGLFGDMGDGQGDRLLGVLPVHHDRPVDYPQSPRERAQLVLTLSIITLGQFPVPCPIPAYAFDIELVCWLEMRMGFQGGGGRHKMTKISLLDLLLVPERLAKAVETHGTRMSNRAGEAVGQQLDSAMHELATRIRVRAGEKQT